MRLSYEFSNVLGAVYHKGTLRFGPNGSSLFSPVGNKVVVYDLKTSKSSSLPFQLNYNIQHLCIHPEGTIMIASSEDSHFYIISLISGKLLHLKLFKSFASISHLSFSPDGRYYCVTGGNLVLVYITPGSMIAGKGREIMPFRLMRKFRVNHDVISNVAWSSDSKHLCVSSQDLSLDVIDLEDKSIPISQLRGHTDSIVNCYFSKRSLDGERLYSVTRSCQLFIWQSSRVNLEESGDANNQFKKLKTRLNFSITSKHYLKLTVDPDSSQDTKWLRSKARITATDYNSEADILVVGYETGHYSLYQLPEATLIYELSSESSESICSISVNPTGDWVAFASSVSRETRIKVWEWQSKSIILDQVGSGANMANLHECVNYSPDGTHIVAGNSSGRIEIWNSLTGQSVASFGDEHRGPIKAIKFVPNKSGKVIVSASLDGSLRAYDLHKFKNFRTFKSPVDEKQPEFICLDVDSTGEFIAAGSYNYFEIYLYSLQSGKFLDYLTGHEGAVSGVAFSPNSTVLISTSWDKTIKIWNIFEGSKTIRDTIELAHEALTVAFRPDGNQFAVSVNNGQICLFDPRTSEQIGAPIEGRDDLGVTHLITEASRDQDKQFLSLNYSTDGSFLLAGGQSNFICIYHVAQKILVKKIAMTFNQSMDGLYDYISNRRRSEFGYNLELLKQRREEGTLKPIQLPGVRRGDLSDPEVKPVIAVNQVIFSPTMRSFTVASTEGVLIYSLDVNKYFAPYKLTLDVDPNSARRAQLDKKFGDAIVQSIQINEKNLFREIIENTPQSEIDAIASVLEPDYVMKALELISQILPDNRHVEYYILWVKKLLYRHAIALRSSSHGQIMSIIRNLHQNIARSHLELKGNSNFGVYSLEFLTRSRPDESNLSNRSNEDEDPMVD